MSLEKNIKNIQEQIIQEARSCGRNPEEISYIMISKGRSVEQIEEAYALGVRDFGENRVDEALKKKEQLPADIRWHFIGRLQKNKVAKIIGQFTLIHSVDNVELAEKISASSIKKDCITAVLLQANTTGEKTKGGLTPQEWERNFHRLIDLKGIDIQGLMTMAPLTQDENLIHHCFKQLRLLQQHLKEEKMKTLSMGMSQDFPIAIQEGANLLRLGSVFFMPTGVNWV